MPKLSTKARYGLRAMIDIALNFKEGSSIYVKDIARREEISEKYLEHILINLKNAGFVKSMRGAKGGYTLNKPPDRIKVKEILYTLEGSLALVDCIDEPSSCTRYPSCIAKNLWIEIHNSILNTLNNKTLQDLICSSRGVSFGENI